MQELGLFGTRHDEDGAVAVVEDGDAGNVSKRVQGRSHDARCKDTANHVGGRVLRTAAGAQAATHVMVIRRLGPFGASSSEVTQASRSESTSCPAKSEHVSPSLPIPRSIRSKVG